MIAQSTNSPQLQAVVDQPIWTGGRISSGIALANAKRDVALAGYGEAIQSIALAVSQSYYELQRWRLREQVLQQSIERQNSMIAAMKRRVAQEVSPLSDLELAQTRDLQLEQQLLQARTQANSAIQRLRELVGDGLYELPIPLKVEAGGPEFVDDEVIEAAQAFDPKLARLKADADALGAEAQIARSGNLPKLSGQYSYSEVLGHRFGLVLRAQSSGGFSGFAAADAARLREQSAEMQVEAANRELRNEMVIDLQTYKAARQQATQAVSSAGYAQRVMESYLRQFTSGRRTWLDVMNAVRELTAAQIDSLDAAINSRSACARILLRTGRWRPAAEEARS